MKDTKEQEKIVEKSYIYETRVTWTQAHKANLNCGSEGEKKPTIEVAVPPEFNGHEGIISPEELFVASINACIMTTFLYFTEKLHANFKAYDSYGKGILSLAETPYRFTKVIIEPTITVENKIEEKMVRKAIELAGKYCLISSSINAKVEILPDIKVLAK
ncbi:MAG: OsmC family protein [Candidatus Thermoplasmatota archaeon]